MQGNACGAKGCRKVDAYAWGGIGVQPRECPTGLSKWESALQYHPILSICMLAAFTMWKWRKPLCGLAEDASTGGGTFFRVIGTLAFSVSIILLHSPLEVKPPTGEPDAGDPHVRFGGRGGAIQCAIPTPIGGAVVISFVDSSGSEQIPTAALSGPHFASGLAGGI